MKKLQSLGLHLSKKEQKKLKGGLVDPGEGGGGGGCMTYLECTTPNGTEQWRPRCCTSANATADCRAIYPAYGSQVTGECYMII